MTTESTLLIPLVVSLVYETTPVLALRLCVMPETLTSGVTESIVNTNVPQYAISDDVSVRSIT